MILIQHDTVIMEKHGLVQFAICEPYGVLPNRRLLLCVTGGNNKGGYASLHDHLTVLIPIEAGHALNKGC